MEDYELTKYAAVSFEYLRKAKEQLELYDHGNLHSLFYAALDLRFGIEMRLEEYRKVADMRKPRSRRYKAKELKKELLSADPEANTEVQVTIGVGDEAVFGMKYTPVSDKLANEYSGRLGVLLHKKFKDNEDWIYGRWWKEQRRFLQQVCDELEYACSGEMLGVPKIQPKR
ncbi:MAG: hypothetical protein V1784_11940 [bacterium]